MSYSLLKHINNINNNNNSPFSENRWHSCKFPVNLNGVSSIENTHPDTQTRIDRSFLAGLFRLTSYEFICTFFREKKRKKREINDMKKRNRRGLPGRNREKATAVISGPFHFAVEHFSAYDHIWRFGKNKTKKRNNASQWKLTSNQPLHRRGVT